MAIAHRKGLAAALMLAGALLLAASPAQADVMKASPSFRKAAEAAQASLETGDLPAANTRISSLQPASALEKYMLASLRFEYAARRNDLRAQRSAVAEMLASGAAPEKQQGYLHYLLGYSSAQLGDANDALSHLSNARKAGYDTSEVALLMAEVHLRRHQGAEALAQFNQAIAKEDAAGRAVPASWLERGAAIAYSQKNYPGFVALATRRLRMAAGPGEWRTAISSYIAGAAADKEAQLDLYRLQNAIGALATERDYHAYSRLAAELGYASEAQSVIEAGRARGKLLPADAVTAPLLASLKAKATANLAEAQKLQGKAASAASGPVALKGGDRLLSAGQYAAAAAYYDQALRKGGVDKDKIGARLGIALARAGETERAKTVLAQVGGRWGEVAAYWASFVANPPSAVAS